MSMSLFTFGLRNETGIRCAVHKTLKAHMTLYLVHRFTSSSAVTKKVLALILLKKLVGLTFGTFFLCWMASRFRMGISPREFDSAVMLTSRTRSFYSLSLSPSISLTPSPSHTYTLFSIIQCFISLYLSEDCSVQCFEASFSRSDLTWGYSC